ncbi:MAG TPA: molybdopterin molybdotransferase MoeA [Candidatus Binatia bacterium]|nr:molybdopterin molybdotransferase MoeA [Candidatus Binatia bacterium]
MAAFMRESAALLPGATFQTERLLAPEQALVAYLSRLEFERPKIETVTIDGAFGRVLARDAVADDAYPSHPRSTMDGFAVVSASGAMQRIVGEIRMGHAPPRAIVPGEALRIPTGGALPDGADAVVPIEDVKVDGDAMEIVEAVEAGDNVTPRGADMQPGERALRAGRRLGGPELAVLATIGVVDVPVYSRPVVAIASTGDELIDPSGKPGIGQVRDSNRYAIAGALTALGCAPLQLPRAHDTRESLEATLREGLARADAVILTGGSSVGERDLTPDAIDALGKPGVIVHGLRVKPGKPTVLAAIGAKPVIGLPGNPASSLMILEAIVAPVFVALTGATPHIPLSYAATAAVDFKAREGWTWYVPAALERDPARGLLATPLPLRSSHTSLLARAHGYVVLGEMNSRIAAGDRVVVHPFSSGGR